MPHKLTNLVFSVFAFVPRCNYTSKMKLGVGWRGYWNLSVRVAGCPSSNRSGKLRTQKFKSHQVRTQSLNILPLKPGVGHYIAIHATLTTRDFSLAYFPSGPFTCIFSKTSFYFLMCWLWLTLVPV